LINPGWIEERAMKVIRWSPTRDLFNLRSEMDRLMSSSMRDLPAADPERLVWAPPADLTETPEGFEIRLDLPGVDRKEVKLSIFGDTVTVSGERHAVVRQEGESWHRAERFAGSFERQFVLGAALDSSKVKAVYGDGVLEIAVAKAESAKPKEIEIEVGG
jgi:HSP20 family protein